MQTLFLQYSHRCFLSLANNLKSASDDSSVEVVHSLRLSIKRIRALLAVIGLLDDSFKNSKVYNKIDYLFLHSGNLRDIQVQTLLLESYRIRVGAEVDYFINQINTERKRLKKQLENRMQKINLFDITLLHQRLDSFIEALDNSTLETNCRFMVDQLLEQIILIIRDNPDEKKLHRIRILLKELIYAFSIIKKGKVTIKYDASFIKLLNTLQQKLGFWHDLEVLLNRIAGVNRSQQGGSILLHHVKSDKNTIQSEIIWSLEKLIKMGEQYNPNSALENADSNKKL